MMGPPCSSFVWMNLANTKRSQANDFEGDWSSGVVHEGNLHLGIAVFFFAYTLVRGAVPVVENPERSLMWETGAMKTLRAAASAGGTATHEATAFRCAFTADAGPCYRKPYKFMSTGQFITGVHRPCTCTEPHAPMTKTLPDGRCRGDPEALEASAAYPQALGNCVIELWLGSGIRATRSGRGSPSDASLFTAGCAKWATSGSESEDGLRVASTKRARDWASGSEAESDQIAAPVSEQRGVRRARQWADSGSD